MWRLVGILLVFATGCATGWKISATLWENKALKAEQSRAAAVAEAQTETLLRVKSANLATEAVGAEYETRLADINARYDALLGRMRDREVRPCPAGALSDPACINHAAARPDGLSPHVREKLARLMRDADVQTARLVACQNWIRRQRAEAE